MTTFGDQVSQYGGVPVNSELTTGSVFFVSSVTGSDGNRGIKPTLPFATLDKATNACTANKNDIVYIMPNHAETIASATSWVPDVAGVQYIGIGMGADAPELTFSATGSTIDISGGNNIFRNIRFVAGVSAVVAACDVNANHVTFDNCTWDFSTSTYDFVIMIDLSAFDYCTVKNCRFIAETATAGSNVAIQFEDSHQMTVVNSHFSGDFAVAVISSTDADVSNNVLIDNNVIYNDDTASTNGGIRMTAACTGVISNNMVVHLSTAGHDDAPAIDPGNCVIMNTHTSKIAGTYSADGLVGTLAT